MSAERSRVLLLAGTSEARALAHRIVDKVDLTVSLAGRTAAPADYPGRIRIGGFGGADGLANHLRGQRIDLLIDATHPFAQTISANASAAAERAGTRRLRLSRPPWPAESGHTAHPSLEAALDALPAAAIALLTTGSVRTSPLERRPDCRLILRTIEPVEPAGSHITVLRARPPFTFAQELALMRDRGITHLVTRNAGGASRARLDAARTLAIPVLMIARPPEPPGPIVSSTAEAVAWMRRTGVF